jgi:hypothetical protein
MLDNWLRNMSHWCHDANSPLQALSNTERDLAAPDRYCDTVKRDRGHMKILQYTVFGAGSIFYMFSVFPPLRRAKEAWEGFSFTFDNPLVLLYIALEILLAIVGTAVCYAGINAILEGLDDNE